MLSGRKIKKKLLNILSTKKIILFIVLPAVLLTGLRFFIKQPLSDSFEKASLNHVRQKYSGKVNSESSKYGVDPYFFLALIMLETSGRDHLPRFEEHIHSRLLKYRKLKNGSFRKIPSGQLKKLSERDIRYFASSWGPFQIMGYNAYHLGIPVQELSGSNAITHGMKWIMKEYGYLIKRKRYKDALHYHNTGRKFPVDGKSLTHDPSYVFRGMKYIEYYRSNKKE
ncbi:MAG: hypothetical protein JXR95_05620 [Deltaproteobacteria bacterium]|nr:hypothetical protein [Deltaproteobacteria bacterium]